MGLRLLCEPEKSHRRSDNRLKIAFSVGFTSSGLNRHDGTFLYRLPRCHNRGRNYHRTDWQTNRLLLAQILFGGKAV